jgi:hypothetical protein
MTPSLYNAFSFTERNVIESIINNYFFIDYGFVESVNGDGTINVAHAKFLMAETGAQLEATRTKNIEVLTFSTKEISFKYKIAQGDKVLLLGLKNKVEKVEDVTIATKQTIPLHYNRDTLKAIPFGIFDENAKVQIDTTEDFNIKTSANVIINSDKNIELNGNNKSFVTYAELNQALQTVWTAIQSHTHQVATTGTAVAQSGTAAPSTSLTSQTLDISASETKTIKTGG